jgi:hypothetical protein
LDLPTIRPTILRAFLLWMPSAVAVTLVCGIAFTIVQQNYRQSANDPQLQMAEDAAAALSAGASPSQVATGPQVDMATSLAPFIIVFDSAGKPLASTASLGGQTPIPPIGVLQTATDQGQNMVTYEPRSGVRAAVEVVRWSASGASGTVVAGRSLREIEQRENELGLMVIAGWLATLFAVGIASLAASWLWAWVGRGDRKPVAST